MSEESPENMDELRSSFKNHLEKNRSKAILDYFEAVVRADYKKINYQKSVVSSIDSTISHIETSRDQDLIEEIETIQEEKLRKDDLLKKSKDLTEEIFKEDDEEDEDEEE